MSALGHDHPFAIAQTTIRYPLEPRAPGKLFGRRAVKAAPARSETGPGAGRVRSRRWRGGPRPLRTARKTLAFSEKCAYKLYRCLVVHCPVAAKVPPAPRRRRVFLGLPACPPRPALHGPLHSPDRCIPLPRPLAPARAAGISPGDPAGRGAARAPGRCARRRKPAPRPDSSDRILLFPTLSDILPPRRATGHLDSTAYRTFQGLKPHQTARHPAFSGRHRAPPSRVR